MRFNKNLLNIKPKLLIGLSCRNDMIFIVRNALSRRTELKNQLNVPGDFSYSHSELKLHLIGLSDNLQSAIDSVCWTWM